MTHSGSAAASVLVTGGDSLYEANWQASDKADVSIPIR